MVTEGISAFVGAVAIKLLEHVVGRDRAGQSELKQLREKLMAELEEVRRAQSAEVQELRAEVVALRREVDTWQSKYHDLRVELAVQRKENDRLEGEVKRMQRHVAQQDGAGAGPLEGPAVLSEGGAA